MTVGLVLTTLRLHRAQIVATSALLAALVLAAAVHGSLTASFIADRLGNSCVPHGCDDVTIEVGQRYQVFGVLVSFLGLLPAAIGAFWGAPLLGREFETHTVRVAWTQSVSRRSWIVTRMITLGLLVALGGVVVGTMVSQWLSVFVGFDLPGVTANDNSFGQLRGAGPVGWWVFGFALGTASGALLRRTVPAMVITVAIVVAATIGRNLFVGTLSVEGSDSIIEQARHIEIATLIGASLVLAAVTVAVVERARA